MKCNSIFYFHNFHDSSKNIAFVCVYIYWKLFSVQESANSQGNDVGGGSGILRYGRSNNGLSHYLVRPGKRSFDGVDEYQIDPEQLMQILFSRSIRTPDMPDDEANIYSRLVKRKKTKLNNKRGLNNFMLRPTRAFSGFLMQPKDIVEKLLDEYANESHNAAN